MYRAGRRGRLPEERGLALPAVLGVILILSILGFAAAGLVQNNLALGRLAGGQHIALACAEAGLHKYLWHLNKDSKYYEKNESEKGPEEARLGVDTPYRNGYYRLAVQVPTVERPVVTIYSTGWAADDPDNRCTLEVQVHKRQFVQQVFLTNAETFPNGEKVYWISGDVVRGPLHTNGSLYISGSPEFFDRVTYGVSVELQSGSRPVYHLGQPEKVAPLVFPASNSQLKTHALYEGYYYSGRTCIWLQNGRLKIKNYQKQSNGTVLIKSEERALPANGVVYVDGKSGSNVGKWDVEAGNVFISGILDGRLTVAAANNIYITGRDPTNPSYSNAAVTGGIKYANEDFEPDGGLTDDLLGLVANGYVQILHYDWPDDTPAGWWDNTAYYDPRGNVAPYDISVRGAIMAVGWGAFGFEEYDRGSPKGTINLVGSLVQKYRGAVGTFSGSSRLSGYNKDYSHDPRLTYDTPPHFLEPLNAGWELVGWRRVSAPPGG
ncbi:MAG: hypothetical protein ACOY81_08585 [Bacillota bacterium]